MNELQQVLLVIAAVVIGGLYLFSQKKKAKQAEKNPQNSQSRQPETGESHTNRTESQAALNNLSEPHIPVSKQTEQRVLKESNAPDETKAQTQLPLEEVSTASNQPVVNEGPKHIVIEDPDMMPLSEVGEVAEDYVPTFGKPQEAPPAAEQTEKVAEKTEPQSFVIVVMGTGDAFPMKSIQHALLGVGLEMSEQQLYVKKDTMGNAYITVANLLEPGTFPAENLDQFQSPGVVLILQLPTTVRAPAAMHDMIMMARKISQRLNCRLYNAERQLLKESDLQAMRDAAIAYESVPA